MVIHKVGVPAGIAGTSPDCMAGFAYADCRNYQKSPLQVAISRLWPVYNYQNNKGESTNAGVGTVYA
jgi:hypothetical protein